MREAGFTVHALSEYTTRKSPLSRTDCTVPICAMFWGGEGRERGGEGRKGGVGREMEGRGRGGYERGEEERGGEGE